MFKVFYEDLDEGSSREFGSKTVTKEEIISFATDYDPQPFHLSDDMAKMTPLGGLCASGWHTCAMTMRMIVDDVTVTGFASLGAAGIENINWNIPVRPGDTLRLKQVYEEKIESKSRPTLGIVKIHTYVYNHHDECVMDMTASVLVGKRPKE